MKTIAAEQAVFTSTDRGPIKGYQLVAKSAGIDRRLEQELSRWSPTRGFRDRPVDWSLNCFPVFEDLTAITRTTLGGPEYSGRGGTQIVTLILVLRSDQLEAYDFNPITLARTAMALGLLKLPLDLHCEQLAPALLLADPLIQNRRSHGDDAARSASPILPRIAALIAEGRRAAVVGPVDPIATADRLIRSLPLESRRDFSFTTGLEPSLSRPFHVHFLSHASAAVQRTLDAQNVVCLNASA